MISFRRIPTVTKSTFRVTGTYPFTTPLSSSSDASKDLIYWNQNRHLTSLPQLSLVQHKNIVSHINTITNKSIQGLKSFSSKEPHHTRHPADGPLEYGYHYQDKDERFDKDRPTLAYAKTFPTSYALMRHEQILQLCVEGNFPAQKEALIRNIMMVDEIEHDEASKIVKQIRQFNRSSMSGHYIPYKVGFVAAMGSGLLSFPLVFGKSTTLWFNEGYVTTDVPKMADLETFLEVGMWSWGWMEPVIGQASFALLILQFARAQLINLGLRPYGDFMKGRRADRVLKEFPQYNPLYLKWFAEGDELFGTEE